MHPNHSVRLPITDGLRAIAVVAVVLFHIFPSAVTGGFIGVDIFFVISGFVIALNYLPALTVRQATFRGFFVRRIQRLVPAYFVILVVTTLAAYSFLRPHELANFGASLTGQALYLQNVVFWVQGDYFLQAETKPLLHTWSLGVEEQFYLFFPLLVLLIRRSRKAATVVAIGAAVLSLSVGLIAAGSSPKTAFYWLPTRVWEFMVGIGIAVAYLRGAYQKIPSSVAATAFSVALVAMVASILLFDETAIFPSFQAALAVVATAVILFIQTQVRLPAILLTNRVAQQFGRISYSWYLWHWPIVTFFFVIAHRRPDTAEGIVCLGLSYVSALISYRYMEKAGQRALSRRSNRVTTFFLISFLTFALFTGGYLVESNGVLNRYSEPIRGLYAAAAEPRPGRCAVLQRLAYYDAEICKLNTVHGRSGLLIVGDSHAAGVKDQIASLGQAAGVPVYFTKMNCIMVGYGKPGFCSEARWQKTVRDIRRFGINKIIAIAYWPPETPPEQYSAGIRRMLSAVPRLYVEKASPDDPYFAPDLRADAIEQGKAIRDFGYSVSHHNQKYRSQIEALRTVTKGVTILDPIPLLCYEGWCPFARDGKPLYVDRDHLSAAGRQLLVPMYQTVFYGEKHRGK